VLDESGKNKRGHWSGDNRYGKVVVMRRSQDDKGLNLNKYSKICQN